MNNAGYRYPFTPYPNAWYFVAETHGMKPGDERNATICGTVIKFRMRRDGIVLLGTEMQCHEDDGKLFVLWGKPQSTSIELPHISEFHDNAWMQPFHLVFRTRTHVQEVAENAIDLAHFSRVHDYLADPTLFDFHLDGPRFFVSMQAPRKLLGVTRHPIMDITYYGLGVVESTVVTESVTVKVLLTSTPINEETLEIHQWIAIKRQGPLRDMVYRFFLPHIIYREFSNDFPIWENKIYRHKAPLCTEEKNIATIRRWARQFY